MPTYIVIETENGLTLATVGQHETPEGVAEKHRGIIVDQTLYKSYDDAYDAMLNLQSEAEEDDTRG